MFCFVFGVFFVFSLVHFFLCCCGFAFCFLVVFFSSRFMFCSCFAVFVIVVVHIFKHLFCCRVFSSSHPMQVSSKAMAVGRLFSVQYDASSAFLLATAGSKGHVALWHSDEDEAISAR